MYTRSNLSSWNDGELLGIRVAFDEMLLFVAVLVVKTSWYFHQMENNILTAGMSVHMSFQ